MYVVEILKEKDTTHLQIWSTDGDVFGMSGPLLLYYKFHDVLFLTVGSNDMGRFGRKSVCPLYVIKGLYPFIFLK